MGRLGLVIRENVKMTPIVLISILVCLTNAQRFPDDFLFGVATASYQVEGAWNVGGKGPSIWDDLTHNKPELIYDGSDGDVACDAYHKTADDVLLLSDMGVNFYRFSISWSRIFPNGFATSEANEDGIRYYNELIDALISSGIQPYITMYHWDLPQPLQEIGGWPNPQLVDHFADYADVLYANFGDRVKNWMTINEPFQVCEAGYGQAGKAPAYTQSGTASYLCMHTLLLAHASAYEIYQKTYKETQQGRVGIAFDMGWAEPDPDSPEGAAAAQQSMIMNHAWYIDPIFSEVGDYPPEMKQRITELSDEEGFSKSRLPTFTPQEIDLVRGSADFLGINHYTSSICTETVEVPVEERPSQWADAGVSCYQDPSWEVAASSWLRVYPEGLKKLLNWVKDRYNNPEVIITENGFSDDSVGTLNDCRRINYYNVYLTALLEAILEDQCNVTGYTAWSFMDNFEWLMGYAERFGLHFVNFTDPERPRTPKKSSLVYKNIITTRMIDFTFDPDTFEPCETEEVEESN